MDCLYKYRWKFKFLKNRFYSQEIVNLLRHKDKLRLFFSHIHMYHQLYQHWLYFSPLYFLVADQELRNVIDKLAQFVARNGPEFEKMTMEKQKDNPKFSFLFGGEYFSYYKCKLSMEQQQRM